MSVVMPSNPITGMPKLEAMMMKASSAAYFSYGVKAGFQDSHRSAPIWCWLLNG